MGELKRTDRTKVRRVAERGVYDRRTINAILDEALVCHVGFVDEGQPFVIPTIHFRVDNRLYVHGSPGSRMLRCLCSGDRACVTVTLLDGLVLARSAFHHSMNYRSVVVLARGEEVSDRRAKLESFDRLVEHVVPGRSADSRSPNDNEVAATALVSFPIDEASAKIRVGPPSDDEADYDLPYWAGVIPLSMHSAVPQSDPRLAAGIPVPAYASEYRRTRKKD